METTNNFPAITVHDDYIEVTSNKEASRSRPIFRDGKVYINMNGKQYEVGSFKAKEVETPIADIESAGTELHASVVPTSN